MIIVLSIIIYGPDRFSLKLYMD